MIALHPLPKLSIEVKVLKIAYGSVDHLLSMVAMRNIIGVADAIHYTVKI